jgi:hypothetical protein
MRGDVMRSVYIKFLTEEDRVQGLFETAKHGRIASLPGEVYQVPRTVLGLLKDLHINYRQATEIEVKYAQDHLRAPSISELQQQTTR